VGVVALPGHLAGFEEKGREGRKGGRRKRGRKGREGKRREGLEVGEILFHEAEGR